MVCELSFELLLFTFFSDRGIFLHVVLLARERGGLCVFKQHACLDFGVLFLFFWPECGSFHIGWRCQLTFWS